MTNILLNPALYEKSALLTREEEIKLSKIIQNKKNNKKVRQKAIHKLVLANVRLVAKIVNSEFSWHTEKEDLVSEGIIGLHKAANSFKHSFGSKFSSYACWHIRGKIQNGLEKANIIKVTRYARSIMGRVEGLKEKMSNDLNRPVTDEEVYELLNLSDDKMKVYDRTLYNTLSFDACLPTRTAEPNPHTLAEITKDPNAKDPSETSEEEDKSNVLNELLETLTPKERNIISLRFGLTGKDPMILEDIGKNYGVTRERIRQLEYIALKKLKIRAEKNNYSLMF